MENNDTNTEVTFEITEYFEETMSPYKLIRSVNQVLADLGIEKELPGPMGYTYCKKGYITTVPGSNNKLVTREAAIEWAEKYLAKLMTKMSKVVEEVVVEEQYVGFENE